MNSEIAPAPIKNPHLGLIIGAIVLLVAGIVVGYVLTKSESEVVQTPTPSTAVISDWKTFQDSKGYFSLQYPSDYTVFPMDLDDGSHGAEINKLNTPSMFSAIVSVKQNTNIASLKTFVDNLVVQYEKDAEQSAAGVNFNTKSIVVDGVQGYVIYSAESSAVANVDVNYYFLKNKVLYNFNSRFSSYAPEHEKIIADMVASMRFIK